MPGESAHRGLRLKRLFLLGSCSLGATSSQFTRSFIFFRGRALTVLDAGFALKTHGSFVKGFTPFRAGLAGFCLSFKFSAPANLKEPTFFSCTAATPTRASMTPLTSFVFKPVDSATDL